jgi:hypothetical protein
MPLPPGVPTVLVTTGEPQVLPDGTPVQGKLEVTGPDLVTLADEDLLLGGTASVPFVDGVASIELVPSDLPGMNPRGWTYEVRALLINGPSWARQIRVDSGPSPVQLAAVLSPAPDAGEYVAVPGPRGPAGPTGRRATRETPGPLARPAPQEPQAPQGRKATRETLAPRDPQARPARRDRPAPLGRSRRWAPLARARTSPCARPTPRRPTPAHPCHTRAHTRRRAVTRSRPG